MSELHSLFIGRWLEGIYSYLKILCTTTFQTSILLLKVQKITLGSDMCEPQEYTGHYTQKVTPLWGDF